MTTPQLTLISILRPCTSITTSYLYIRAAITKVATSSPGVAHKKRSPALVSIRSMRLTKEQLNSYEENGYLLVPDCFSRDEIESIASELPGVFQENTPRKVLERSGAVRSVFAPHVSNETFDRLSRHPHILEPAQQLLDDDVYIHHYKINAKVALEGDQWEWHQDFVYWHREDSMPAPRALTAVLFMQEVNEFN